MDQFDEKMDTSQNSNEDPNSNLSEYFLNHPCATNKAYEFREDEKDDEQIKTNEEIEIKEEEKPVAFIRPSLRDDAPLAGILHPSLDNLDPRIFFSDFQPNKTLRFSRLFASNIKPSSKAEIWWPSKTFHRKLPKDKQKIGPSAPKRCKLNIVDKADDEMLKIDQEPLMIRSSEIEDTKKEENNEIVAPWRVGPAKVWYDMMNVPSTSTSVNYGFRVKKDEPIRKPIRKTKDVGNSIDEASTSTKSSGISNRVETFDKGCGTNEDIIMPHQVIEWEKDVIINGEKKRMEILNDLAEDRVFSYGWIPTNLTRSYEQFVLSVQNGSLERVFDTRDGMQGYSSPLLENKILPTPSMSIFPSAPSDLDLYNWEDQIIWDADSMPENPEPIMLMVDFADDPLIYGLPEDRKAEDEKITSSERKENQYTKKSKMILGQVQQRQKQEEDEQMESSMAQFTDNDPFNLSNDDYYIPKGNSKTSSSNSLLIQHSTPAQNIHRAFFPTYMTNHELRHWHRPCLTRRVMKLFAPNRFQIVQTTTRHQQKMGEIREKMKATEGGGDIFFMRDVNDLTGLDGDLILIEYSEEHPVVLSQPGMSGKLKNYYKRKPGNEVVEPTFELGEMAFGQLPPTFLGQLKPGQSLQSVENNMYQAPIYRHRSKNTDFLLIRNRNSWFIRKCPPLFVAGQQCPAVEVPSPNSKRATAFIRDFLFAYIYRLFWASEHQPRRLRMEDIKNAFPQYVESNIRKRLKQCSTFTRSGQDAFWLLKPEFRLPTKEEVLSMITPEMCCVQYSMMAAEQRLKDAGYGEKYFFTPENDDASEDEVTIEDEIKCAPWNTTRAFLASKDNKCLLDQTGIADPTGCGQGFSYVRVSQKPHKEDIPAMPKKLVTGTNADLRKLPLKEAKEICRGYGVKEEEINALTRWEIIDVIRTLSTQAAKATKEGETVSGMARFARGNTRFSSADMQEKYRKHCQRIFDLQNQTLANPEALSTDDDSSDVDSDNEELARRLENMLKSNKGKKHISMSEKAQMEYESEEKEREDLKRMMTHGDTIKKNISANKKEATAEEKQNASKFGEDVAMSASKLSGVTANQKLKIYRTTRHEDGTETTRVEVVTRPQLIEAYTRIRMTRDDTFIQVYAQMDEQYKEEKRKKKRRLQDQLRRIKKNDERQMTKPVKEKQPAVEKKPIVIKPNLQKMRCSACQAFGHMKTNKNCPLYGKDPLPPIKEEDGEQIHTPIIDMGEVMTLEGTKLTINKKALMLSLMPQQSTPNTPISRKPKSSVSRLDSLNTDEAASISSISRFDKDDEDISESSISMTTPAHIRGAARTSSVSSSKRRTSVMPEEDYLHGPVKSVHRLRADPKVTMSTLLTEIVNELKTIPGADHHLMPVNAKKVPDYYLIIKNPMDLQKIKNKISDQSYELRMDFLGDVKQMLDNSRLYNGDNHIITVTAQQMLELAGKRMVEREDKFIALEKQINPLLDDNDRVGFSHLLCEIVQKCKNIPKSVVFHTKVDQKKMPLYYMKVLRPMDLGTIENNAKQRMYTTVKQFRDDMEQIYRNSESFNGPVERNAYTAKAFEIYELAQQLINEKAEQLNELEMNINQGLAISEDYDDSSVMDELKEEISINMDNSDVGESSKVYVDESQEETDVEPTEDLDESNDTEMQPMNEDDEDSMMWEDGMNMAGQVINDLALSDSDEDERLDEIRRANHEDDNKLDSF
ncbi:unnamed protein product [Caenorhabditis angaria]|uniref:Bromo domain-containing protein n=1 Tax=Caenorhabditis angaria TaxID=860376 RepID=A0A9P1I5D6_9PELO|nr:unnamed protein product [Caenorhabditis angaria]